MKISVLLFSVSVLALPLRSVGQVKKEAAPPLLAGKDVAVVATESGKVRGYIHNGTFTFKGIPYAKAERFMVPTKPDSWTGVRSSMSYGPVCPMLFDNQCVEKYHHNKDVLAIGPPITL